MNTEQRDKLEVGQSDLAAESKDKQAELKTLVTLNGKQLKDLLDATWPDRDDEDQADTEITLIEFDKPFKSVEGEDMPAGLYFYYDEYPEEGIILIATQKGERQ